MNQLLVHAGNTPAELMAYCESKNILVEAYSPIAHGEILKNADVAAIAEKYGVSVPQLCIRYTLQLGTVSLPKTANPEHMRSNAEVDFVISDEDMDALREPARPGLRRVQRVPRLQRQLATPHQRHPSLSQPEDLHMITYDFTDKVAFVTGAAAGMGAATARAFAQAGAAVAIVDRDAEAAEKLTAELTGAGHRAIAIACDVSDEPQVKNAVDTTARPSAASTWPSTTQGSCSHRSAPPTRPPTPSTRSSR